MTRYYVDISTELIDQILEDDSRLPEGFRFISRFGPKVRFTERWIVEDDGAPEELEGFLVTPSFSVDENGTVSVVSRETH